LTLKDHSTGLERRLNVGPIDDVLGSGFEVIVRDLDVGRSSVRSDSLLDLCRKRRAGSALHDENCIGTVELENLVDVTLLHCLTEFSENGAESSTGLFLRIGHGQRSR
ncbi:hypothetical protein PENTCL1PPCAC_16855, partial [Pristionchus entomophagus]